VSLFGAGPGLSGVAVTEQTALQIAAVWAAVKVIADGVAALPLHLYRRLPTGGKERYTGHPLYPVLHDLANPTCTAMVFRQTLQQDALIHGNGYAEILRNAKGDVAELHRIFPPLLSPRMDGARRVWDFVQDDGTRVTLPDERIFHLPGLGDAMKGYAPIRLFREALGLTMATEQFGAAFFGNGTRFGGILEHPGRLSETVKKSLRDALDGIHRGVAKANKVAILEEGMKYHAVGTPPEESQFLETRQFQVLEVCRIFNISPTKLRDLSRSTYSNTEQEALDFARTTLRPWLVLWEQEIARSLIRPLERGQQFAQFLDDAVLRADTLTRFQAYAIASQWGFFSINDIREKENLNPIPGGDVYLVPTNMVPADRLNDVVDAQVRPPPAPAPAPPPAEDQAEAARAAVRLVVAPVLADVERRLAELPAALQDDGLRATVAAVASELASLSTATAATAHELRATLDGVAERLTALAARPSDLAPLLAETTAHRAQVAALAPRLRALLEDQLRLFVRTEGERARRAAESPDKLRAWMAGFYPRQAARARSRLWPVLALHLALAGREADTDATLDALVATATAESRAALEAALAGPPEALPAAVAALTARWEAERPAVYADRIQEEVLRAA
jgi:HK97 family phage portal protein